MKALGQHLLVLLGAFSLATACGQRTADTPTLGTSGGIQNVADTNEDRTAELEKLIRDQSDALTKLSSDKTALEQRSATLEAQIKTLNDSAATGKALTAEQQKQLTDLQTQKADVDKQLAAANAKNVELQKQLDAAKTENARLQKELAAAKGSTVVNNGNTASTAKFHIFKYADPTKTKNDCFDVQGASTGENVQINAYPCSATAQNQHFEVLDPANRFFIIRARHSNKCVTASGTADTSPILQKTCNNGAEQSWEFYVRGQADFRLKNAYSGKCIKIANNGALVQGDCDTNSTFFNWLNAI